MEADNSKETNEILTNKKGISDDYNSSLWSHMDNGEASKQDLLQIDGMTEAHHTIGAPPICIQNTIDTQAKRTENVAGMLYFAQKSALS